MLTGHAMRFRMRRLQNGSGWIWIVFILMLIAGCSKWSGGGPRMPGQPSLFSKTFRSGASDGGFRRKIGVVPFQMTSQFGDPATKNVFQNDLLKAVEAECANIIFVEPDDGRYPEVLMQLPKLPSGEIDNYRLAMGGRQAGLFGVMTGTVTSINVDSEHKGIWFLRRTDYYIRVEVLVEIYSMETAAKLFDRAISERIEVDEADVELIRSQNRIDQSSIDKALKEIIDDLRGGICYAIRSLGWKSYIVSTNDDDIMIASGSQSGIQVGNIFNVYDNGRTIEGFGEHRFAIIGNKIGEIKITATFEDSARAIPLSGSGFQAGQAVGTKK